MKCEQCGSTERLTKDHIIPKWLWKRMKNFGVGRPLSRDNIQILCYSCNNKKGGKIDFQHPLLADLRKKLLEILN